MRSHDQDQIRCSNFSSGSRWSRHSSSSLPHQAHCLSLNHLALRSAIHLRWYSRFLSPTKVIGDSITAAPRGIEPRLTPGQGVVIAISLWNQGPGIARVYPPEARQKRPQVMTPVVCETNSQRGVKESNLLLQVWNLFGRHVLHPIVRYEVLFFDSNLSPTLF